MLLVTAFVASAVVTPAPEVSVAQTSVNPWFPVPTIRGEVARIERAKSWNSRRDTLLLVSNDAGFQRIVSVRQTRGSRQVISSSMPASDCPEVLGHFKFSDALNDYPDRHFTPEGVPVIIPDGSRYRAWGTIGPLLKAGPAGIRGGLLYPAGQWAEAVMKDAGACFAAP